MSKPELTTLDYERMFYATMRKNQNANRNRTRRFHLGSVVNITEKEARDMLAKSNYVTPKGK